MFNKDITKCFESSEPRAALRQAQERIVELLNQLASFTSARLHSHQRMSIEALLTITVHNRDILLNMIQSKTQSGDDFEWKR